MRTLLANIVAFAAAAPLFAQQIAPAPAVAPAAAPERIRALVISGENNHDWRWTSPSLSRILGESNRFDVVTTFDPGTHLADAEIASAYDVFIVDYNGKGWGDAAHDHFLAAVWAGAGAVIIHAADNNGKAWPEYERLVGDMWREGTGHGRFHSFDVNITDRDHPVTRTLPTILLHPDELYHNLVNVHSVERRVLATAFSEKETGGTGEDEPMILVRQYGKGRVFHTPLGHVWKGNLPSQASHRDPQFRGLIVRGAEWAATGDVADEANAPAPLTSAEMRAGWVSLHDRGLWQSFGGGAVPAGWVFEDDIIRRDASAGDIVTRALVSDFELRFQWKTTIASNSGLKYRLAPDATAAIAPEYQLLDHWGDAKNPKHRAGAIYDVVAAQPPADDRPAPTWGDFHTARIVAKGTKIEHWLDGVLVANADTASDEWQAAVQASKFKSATGFAAAAPGRLLLQDHGDEVMIRGLRVREIAAPVRVDDDLAAIFSTSELDAWTNVGDATYRVERGVLIGNAGPERKQSFLVSKETLHDFELNVDVKIAVTGNSGIQLRSHVIDGRMRGYQAEIDPTDRSWSGGIYGEGGRGWLDDLSDNQDAREAFNIADWNNYRIVCEGTRIQTWINGVPAADLLDSVELSGKLAFQIHGGDDDIEIRWRDARLMRIGAHDWQPAPTERGGPLRNSFGDARALRALVTGDSSQAVVELEDGSTETLSMTDSKYWHDGGHNRVAVLRQGNRFVLQLGDRTAHDRTFASAPRAVRFEKADRVSEWESPVRRR